MTLPARISLAEAATVIDAVIDCARAIDRGGRSSNWGEVRSFANLAWWTLSPARRPRALDLARAARFRAAHHTGMLREAYRTLAWTLLRASRAVH